MKLGDLPVRAGNLSSASRKLPAAHALGVLNHGNWLRHLSQLWKAVKNADEQPEIRVIQKILIRLNAEISQKNKEHYRIPPDRKPDREINGLPELLNNTPTGP